MKYVSARWTVSAANEIELRSCDVPGIYVYTSREHANACRMPV
jgi:hypothetical protein